MDLQQGSTRGYVEVFGESAEQWLFPYGDARILVDEQYCTNPSCDCRQGLLTFVQLEAGKSVRKFVIGYPIRKTGYKVLDTFTTKRELEEMVAAFEQAYPMA